MSYKLYQSKKWIFWDNPAMNDYPDFITNDQWFNWETVDTNSIHFETYKTGKITVKDQNVTYFKLEKDGQPYSYWFVKNIDRILSVGVVYNVELDFYMTYTKVLLNDLTKNTNRDLLLQMDRVSLANGMLNDNDLRHVYINSTTLTDPLINEEWLIYDEPEIKKGKTANNLKVIYNHKADGVNIENRMGTLKWTNKNDWKKRGNLWNTWTYAVFNDKQNYKQALLPLINPLLDDFHVGVDINLSELPGNPVEKVIRNSLPNMLIDFVGQNTTAYGADGFLGIYKGPFIPFETYHLLSLRYGDKDGIKTYGLYIGQFLDQTAPFNLWYPVDNTIDLDESTVDTFANMWDKIQYTKARKKKLDYMKFVTKQGTNWKIVAEYFVYFSNEFLLVPRANQYTSENDIEGFGGVLPSPDSSYAKTITQARQTYDMGLASLAQSTASAGFQTLLAGGVGGIGGALASGISSGIGLIGQAFQNEQAYRNKVAGASQTWVNSNSTDLYYYLQVQKSILKDQELWEPSTMTVTENWLEFRLYNNSRHMIKQIYHLYGFPVNSFASFGKMLDRSWFTRRFYLQLNPDWIRSNIRRICQNTPILANESSEILQAVAEQLSNGLRIWLQNQPFYDEFKD